MWCSVLQFFAGWKMSHWRLVRPMVLLPCNTQNITRALKSPKSHSYPWSWQTVSQQWKRSKIWSKKLVYQKDSSWSFLVFYSTLLKPEARNWYGGTRSTSWTRWWQGTGKEQMSAPEISILQRSGKLWESRPAPLMTGAAWMKLLYSESDFSVFFNKN